jgi:uncharacterized protein (DUF169 family)
MGTWVAVANKCKEILCLEGSPVAVSLRKELLPGVEIPKERFTFCQFVQQARVKRKVLQATENNIICCKGASTLGLYDPPRHVMSGKRDAGRKVKDIQAGQTLQSEIPRITAGVFHYVIVSALERTPVDPDVILFVGYPAQIWRICQSAVWKDGKRLSFSTSTSQGVCGDGVVVPYLTNGLNISLGCTGMRVFAGYSEHQMIVGLSVARFWEMSEGLEATSAGEYTYPIPYETYEATPRLPRAWTIMREVTKEEREKLSPEILKKLELDEC